LRLHQPLAVLLHHLFRRAGDEVGVRELFGRAVDVAGQGGDFLGETGALGGEVGVAVRRSPSWLNAVGERA
jgi:hypothetical protein